MIDPTVLSDLGSRTMGALTALDEELAPPRPSPAAYALGYARVLANNLLHALEEDAGVPPGYFGSQGVELPLPEAP